MNHLTMEQLLQLRGPATDPGSADARAHLEACEACRNELDRLYQRVARLKALPALRPSRDNWPSIHQQIERARHRRQTKWMGIASLAAAAAITLAVVLTDLSHPENASATAAAAIDTAKEQSRELENALLRYNPESRVIDGRTARIAADLEDRIARLDQQLEMTQLQPEDGQDEQLLRLWRQRVGLLDALVDVHITRASNVGL
jgi:DNA repair exonuclease SbcCD ATPase subunit